MKLKFSKFPAGTSNSSGSACDVLFIHGTGSSARMWESQVSFLNDLGHNCFAIDLRGHGESEEPCEPTDLAVHTDDILETLDSADIRFPCAFVGHSLGAIISVSMAQTRPELFKVVFAAALPARVLKPVSLVFRVFMGTTFDTIKTSGVHRNWSFRPRTLIETERHALEEIMRNFEAVDFLTEPPVLQCPLHLAAGRFDPVAPCVYAVDLHKRLPSSTLEIFEMAGHNFMDMYPEKFNSWLEKGLAELS